MLTLLYLLLVIAGLARLNVWVRRQSLRLKFRARLMPTRPVTR